MVWSIFNLLDDGLANLVWKNRAWLNFTYENISCYAFVEIFLLHVFCHIVILLRSLYCT